MFYWLLCYAVLMVTVIKALPFTGCVCVLLRYTMYVCILKQCHVETAFSSIKNMILKICFALLYCADAMLILGIFSSRINVLLWHGISLRYRHWINLITRPLIYILSWPLIYVRIWHLITVTPQWLINVFSWPLIPVINQWLINVFSRLLITVIPQWLISVFSWPLITVIFRRWTNIAKRRLLAFHIQYRINQTTTSWPRGWYDVKSRHLCLLGY